MLEYDIKKIGRFVIKKPKEGFEFKVKRDVKLLNFLKDITPPTCYDSKRNILIQKYIEGRHPTNDELEQISKEIEKRGVIPRGITKSDVIIDKSGKFYILDVGNFEIDKKALPKYQETKIPSCDSWDLRCKSIKFLEE